jgi:RNA polymerase sigma-70 factor (ECF subfamily)
MKENEIIELLRSNNPQGFRELFDSHILLVYNVCLRILSNKADAEDVAQEVFFEAYKSLKSFRFDSKISTWLYRIAVNRSLNHQRKKKLERWFSLDFYFEDDNVKDFDPSGPVEERADHIMEKKDTERIVLDAINSLPQHQRVATLLHRYEELSYEDIARIMGVSVASVESRLHRAKQSLAKKLLSVKNEL